MWNAGRIIKEMLDYKLKLYNLCRPIYMLCSFIYVIVLYLGFRGGGRNTKPQEVGLGLYRPTSP